MNALDEYFRILLAQLPPHARETVVRRLVDLHNQRIRELNDLVLQFFLSHPGLIKTK